jgi:hypothetical protein
MSLHSIAAPRSDLETPGWISTERTGLVTPDRGLVCRPFGSFQHLVGGVQSRSNSGEESQVAIRDVLTANRL